MSAHEKGIEAAIKAAEEVDWVSGLFGSGIGSGEELFIDQLRAYLQASGLILLPREPTKEMIERLTKIIRRSAWGRENVILQFKDLVNHAELPFPSPLNTIKQEDKENG